VGSSKEHHKLMSDAYIDGHCHLADPRFYGCLDQVLEESRAVGVKKWVQGGVCPEDWIRQIELKDKYDDSIVLCFGLHPWWVAQNSFESCKENLTLLERLVPQAAGVGELGLDFSSRFDKSTYDHQTEAFTLQLQMACRLNLPIVLHVVSAHQKALATLRLIGVPSAGGLVHSFTGSTAVMGEYLKLGLSISVSGAVTQKGYHGLKRAVAAIPNDRLILETDAPDQAPAGWDRPYNTPKSLIRVAEAIAVLRGESANALLQQSTENLIQIFKLEIVK
jgi:TatD DNase family protein